MRERELTAGPRASKAQRGAIFAIVREVTPPTQGHQIGGIAIASIVAQVRNVQHGALYAGNRQRRGRRATV